VKIPVMLLQPLYENAVKHGVYESTESVRIYPLAVIANGYLEITISNNYDQDQLPAKGRGTGTGLQNVSRRLELYYGKKGSFKTTMENGIYTVRIYIPVNHS
jgi:sensor histidine kinase YesM